jgi:hypothetical protein
VGDVLIGVALAGGAGALLRKSAHARHSHSKRGIVPELLRFLAQHADRNAVDQSTLER